MKKSNAPILWHTIEGFCLMPNTEYYIAYGEDAREVRQVTWNVKYKNFSYPSTQPSFCSHDHTVNLSEVKYIMDIFSPEQPDFGRWSEETNIEGNYVPDGVELIGIERKEQIDKHGYDSHHDKQYNDENSHAVGSDLRMAAMHSLWPEGQFYPKTWSSLFNENIVRKSYKERLIIAGALIAAEIDRINQVS